MSRNLDPNQKHPMIMPDGSVIKTVVHLNQVIDHPRIEIGDFTYFGHLEELDDYAGYLAPFTFPISREKLIIGKFCQIAHGVRIITASANHEMGGFSTFPFANFRMSPETTPAEIAALFETTNTVKDTVIGHDVWIGMNAMIMPNVTIGDGAIIGAGAVVVRDVPPYSIVGGNPATLVRKRFDDAVIERLLAIKWWDWDIEKIQTNQTAILGADIEALENA